MRKHVKEIGKFFVFVAIFFALTSPFVVLFGPFDNLKRTVIGAILKSRHPQYITWLFSQEEIDEILGGISSTPKQELFKFKARTDSTLTLKNIDSSRFKGFLLEIPDPHRVQVATAENMDEKGVKTAWTNAVNECSTKLSLKDADKDILMTLGKNIGRTDTDDQIKNIKYIKSMIAEQEKQAQSEYRRFGKMYRNGGVLVGLLIVIMLI